ncbi:MAG: hypothetical protein B7Z16_17700 [Algoriphagus sp. 32-45-6]|nr:MAG: hypothetical protein B7Z16_17700 [Algoriphagus sp. 32-45-6]
MGNRIRKWKNRKINGPGHTSKGKKEGIYFLQISTIQVNNSPRLGKISTFLFFHDEVIAFLKPTQKGHLLHLKQGFIK